jgi:hypothetical protein
MGQTRVQTGADPHRREPPPTAALNQERNHPASRKPITMPAIIALVLAAIVALTVLGFVLHVLFSPWLLVAVAIVAWIKFRPSRSRQ